jgi:transcriptional regulator with XRE-family HTH domain
MGGMTRDWPGLAAAIKHRRAILGLTQLQLATAAGVTSTTVRNLEGGREPSRIPSSIHAIEHALGWETGSARAILAGGEATMCQGALMGAGIGDSGIPYELHVSDLQGAARNGILATIPHATAAEILAAEQRIIEILRENGKLPPISDDTDKPAD